MPGLAVGLGLRVDEPVTDVPLCKYVLGSGRIIPQLVAQMLNVNLQVTGFIQVIPSPDLAEQGAAGNHLARAL